VSKNNGKVVQKRKRRIERRLRRKWCKAQAKPVFSAKSIDYEVADRAGGIAVGGSLRESGISEDRFP